MAVNGDLRSGPTALSAAVGRMRSSAIRDLLEITQRPEIISLAGGLPNPAMFPVDAIAEATAAVLASDHAAALQYTTTAGHGPLREWVAARHRADIERVVITHGSQQALELIARAVVDPGRPIVLADPGYVGALQAFRLVGAELIGIPSDEHGLRVDSLADRLDDGLRPALVYVVSNFDNPSGATLGEDRRRMLAGLADQYGFLIVDDDPYGELRWNGDAPPALATMTDRVVQLSTTSKILCPGLRVGWAVAPPDLAQVLVLMKQAADLQTATLTQHIAHRVLAKDGFLAPHIAMLRTTYQQQCDALSSALRAEFRNQISFIEPSGGMFLWARLAGFDARRLLDVALTHGVAFVPGREFGVTAAHEDGLRLSFATATPEELREAARRLAVARDSYRDRRGAAAAIR